MRGAIPGGSAPCRLCRSHHGDRRRRGGRAGRWTTDARRLGDPQPARREDGAEQAGRPVQAVVGGGDGGDLVRQAPAQLERVIVWARSRALCAACWAVRAQRCQAHVPQARMHLRPTWCGPRVTPLADRASPRLPRECQSVAGWRRSPWGPMPWNGSRSTTASPGSPMSGAAWRLSRRMKPGSPGGDDGSHTIGTNSTSWVTNGSSGRFGRSGPRCSSPGNWSTPERGACGRPPRDPARG